MHRPIAADFTGLWGLTREMNNLVISKSLIGAVKASYCLNVCTGQSSKLCGDGLHVAWKTPFSIRQSKGCLPVVTSSTWSWAEDMKGIQSTCLVSFFINFHQEIGYIRDGSWNRVATHFSISHSSLTKLWVVGLGWLGSLRLQPELSTLGSY